jgi:AbrB family looped-hinge helix DNA binding protein
MKQFLATISRHGQITVPAEIRRHLGLEANDKLVFVIESDGRVLLRKLGDSVVASLSGKAGNLPKSIPWNEMRDIAREDALKVHGQEDQ